MSLDTPYDRDNIFAKILRNEIPCTTVYEDDDVLSFMDAFPQSRGHTLVIPKSEAVNLFEVDPEVLQVLISKTQMIAKAVRKSLEPDGVIITQFNGEIAGQSVFHIHFHIIPRYISVPQQRHNSGEMADMAELGEIARKIAAAL